MKNLVSIFITSAYLSFIFTVINATIIAVKCKDGIIIGTDSQTSSSISSPYISNRFLRKMFLLTSQTVVCCTGDEGSNFMRLYEELKTQVKIEDSMSYINKDKSGSKILGTGSIYNLARRQIYSKFPKSHIIIGGGDIRRGKSNEKEVIYRLFEVLPGGSGVEQSFIVAGSGANTAVTLLNEQIEASSMETLPTEEAAKLVSKVLMATMRMDRKTGGNLNMWVISDPQVSYEVQNE